MVLQRVVQEQSNIRTFKVAGCEKAGEVQRKNEKLQTINWVEREKYQRAFWAEC